MPRVPHCAAGAAGLTRGALLRPGGCIPSDFAPRVFCIWLAQKKWFGNIILVLIMVNCGILAVQRPTSGAAVKCSVPDWSEEEAFDPDAHNCGPTLLDETGPYANVLQPNCTVCQHEGLCSCNGPLDAVGEGSFKNAKFAASVEMYFTIAFSLEAIVKIIASGFIMHQGAYLRNGWNWLDWIVVVMSWAALIPGVDNFSAIRTVRVLRPLRTMSRIPGMGVIVGAMLKSLRPLSNVMLLCGVIFFVFGILGVQFWYNLPKSYCGPDSLYYSDIDIWRNPERAMPDGTQTNYQCHNLNTLEPVDENGQGPSCACDQFAGECEAAPVSSQQCIGVRGFSKEIHFFKGVNFDELAADPEKFTTGEAAEAYTSPNLQDIDTPAKGFADLVDADTPYHFNDNSTWKSDWKHSMVYNYNLQDAGCECGQVCTSALHFYCDSMGGLSFDNIGYTMITIFQSVTLEGWTDLMYRVDELPNPIMGGGWIYFIILIFLAGLFVVNLALAVIAESYGEATDEEETREAEMEEERGKQEEKEQAEQLFSGPQVQQPKNTCRKRCLKGMKRSKKTRDLILIRKLRELVEDMRFTWFVMLFIGVNTFLLAMDQHEDGRCTAIEMTLKDVTVGNDASDRDCDEVDCLLVGELGGPCMDKDMTDTLEMLNVALTVFFAGEMVLKMIAMGLMDYFSDSFNQFDSFIVATSLFELIMTEVSAPKAHAGGGFITVLRAGRLFRVFKLARAWTALKKVLDTVAKSMGALLPLSIILFLFMFIYSLLGMQLYGGKFFFPARGDCYSWERHENGCSIPRANYDEFATAMVTIFQMMTGEDWNVVMYDGMAASSVLSCLYFFVLVIFGNYIILNLFLAILLSGFEGGAEDDSDDEEEEDATAVKSDGPLKKLCSCCGSSKVAPDGEGEEEGMDKLHGPAGIKHLAESDRDEKTIPDHKAMCLFSKHNPIRKSAFALITNSTFENLILVCIIISSLALGVQNPVNHDGPNKATAMAVGLATMDFVFLIIFTIEFALKHVGYGVVLHPRAYWRDPWNAMDGFIVFVGWIGFLAEDLPQLKPLRAIRTMRALRPLRALRRFPGMKLAVNCLLRSIPLMLPMALVSALFFLIFAILGLQLFAGTFWYCDFSAHDGSGTTSREFLSWLTGYNGQHVATCVAAGLAVPADCAWTSNDFSEASCPGNGGSDGPDAGSCTYETTAHADSLVNYVNELGYTLREADDEFAYSANPLATVADVMSEFPYFHGAGYENYKPEALVQQALVLLNGFTCTGTATDDTETCEWSATTGCPAGCTQTATPTVDAYRDGSGDPYAWDIDGDAQDLLPVGEKEFAKGFDEFCQHPNSLHGDICTRAECRLAGGVWSVAMTHFDNIWESLLCLFEMSTTEGWPAVMWAGVDSGMVGRQPTYKNPSGNLGTTFYFIFFLVVGNFFVLNLFVGAVIDNYLDLEEAAKKDMELMTPEQKEWVETQKKMVSLQLRAKIPEPENAFRKAVYKIVQKTAFDVIVTLLIIINILILAMKHRAMASWFSEGFLVYSNWFFTFAFIIEAVFKIVGYGFKHYFKDNWNRFDFVLVAISILDKVMKMDGIGTFFRVFRVARIVRVARSASDLRRMAQTIIISIPALGNVGSLLILLFFIYSILGVNFFHSACAVPPYFATLGGAGASQGGMSLDEAMEAFDPCADVDNGYGFEAFVSVNVAQNRDLFFALALDANEDGAVSAAEWQAAYTAEGDIVELDALNKGTNTISVVNLARQEPYCAGAAAACDVVDPATCPTGQGCSSLRISEVVDLSDATKDWSALLALAKPALGTDVCRGCTDAGQIDVEVTEDFLPASYTSQEDDLPGYNDKYVPRPYYVQADWDWVKEYADDARWVAKGDGRPPLRCAELTLQCDGFEDPFAHLLEQLDTEPACYGIASCAAGVTSTNTGADECQSGQARPTCDLDASTDGTAECPAGCASTAGFPAYSECTCENMDYNANFRNFGTAFITLIR